MGLISRVSSRTYRNSLEKWQPQIPNQTPNNRHLFPHRRKNSIIQSRASRRKCNEKVWKGGPYNRTSARWFTNTILAGIQESPIQTGHIPSPPPATSKIYQQPCSNAFSRTLHC